MTEQEVIQLSNEVAELYGIDAYEGWYSNDNIRVYLHQDWQRLMPLAVEHGVLDIGFHTNDFDEKWGEASIYKRKQKRFTEGLEYHPTKERAVAVAILFALKAKKEK